VRTPAGQIAANLRPKERWAASPRKLAAPRR
jgi:hypothetical protein